MSINLISAFEPAYFGIDLDTFKSYSTEKQIEVYVLNMNLALNENWVEEPYVWDEIILKAKVILYIHLLKVI